MRCGQKAEIIIKNIMRKINVSTKAELARILGIAPATVTKTINEGRIPDRWIDKISEIAKINRDELLLNEKTISEIAYQESLLPPNAPGQQRIGEHQDHYTPDAWRQFCLAHFGDLFDYIAEIYGRDARSIERFKRDLRIAIPDFRLWLYGEDEKKTGSNCLNDIQKAGGGG